MLDIRENNKVIISYENIAKNIKIIKAYNQDREIIAVVKNNAYNCGIEKVVKCLYKEGITFFATSNLDEAMKIFTLGLNLEVLILNPLNLVEFQVAYEHKCHILIYNIESILKYGEFLQDMYDQNIKGDIMFHIKINIGMNRYGVKTEDIKKLISKLDENIIVKNKVVGLMTHFAQAESNQVVHNNQIQEFVKSYDTLNENMNFKYIHSENSETFLQNNPLLNFCNYARVGILIYGYKPLKWKLKLYPAIYLKSKIVNINMVKKGDYIGYGENVAFEDMLIGICFIGYGDGIISRKKQFPVYICGNYYKIIGDISMSHMYIKIDENIKVGDEVEIYGDNIGFAYEDIELDTELMCALKH